MAGWEALAQGARDPFFATRPRSDEVTPEWLRQRADRMQDDVDRIRERASTMEAVARQAADPHGPGQPDAPVPCTCTLACIPQGITEAQTCRMQLECCGDPGDCGTCGR